MSSYTVEDTYVFADPARPGYEFKGWYTDPGYTNKIERLNRNTGDLYLFAKWEVINYPIIYVLNGGTNSPANPSTYTIEDNIVLEPATRDGYVFEGWYTDPGFASMSAVSAITFGTTEEQTYYARFIENAGEITATITFVENPESDIYVDGPVQNGNQFTFTADTGYVSYQWYLKGKIEPSATGNSFTIDVTDWPSGYYDISLIAYDGTNYWSWSGQLHKE